MRKDWEVKKLGDVCEIERGGSPRPISEYITNDINGINWIKIGDASDNSKYISSTKEKIKPEGVKKSRMVYKGDFILSNSMSFGKPYILDLDGCIHDGWLVIRDINNLFDKSFLYYYLSSPQTYQEFKRMAVGGVVNNLNSNLVRSVCVSVPPLQIQHQIVEELDCLTSIIGKQKKQLEELDNLAQSIFYDMFGDPIENEKGWDIKKIKDISFSVNYGTSSPSTDDGKYKYLRMNNITTKGSIDLSSIKYINVSFEDLEKYVVRKGDILFNRTNSKELVGKTALYTFEEDMIIAGYIIRLRVIDSIILPIFLSSYMNTPCVKEYFRSIAKGAVNQSNINSKQLLSTSVYIPPLSLQQQFASKIEAIERQKELIKKSIKETEDLFNSRMDYYFN